MIEYICTDVGHHYLQARFLRNRLQTRTDPRITGLKKTKKRIEKKLLGEISSCLHEVSMR